MADYDTIKLPDGTFMHLGSISAKDNFWGGFSRDQFKYNNWGRGNLTAEMITAASNYYFSTGQRMSLAQLKKLFPRADLKVSDMDAINHDIDLVVTAGGVDTEQLYYDTAEIREALKNDPNMITWENGIPKIEYKKPETESTSDNNTSDNNTSGAVSTSDDKDINNDGIVEGEEKVTPKEEAMAEFESNPYYTDTWSLQPGTTGYSIYNNLANVERNAALSNMQLADAQYQNAAMQQAATVKSITDQVRSERMAKLRAGMNEAQIANQDMQMMMSNINSMNDQMNAMNYSNLQAQQQYNLAQDTAYQEYLTQAQAMNQSGAAYYAAQAGDATYAAKWLKDNPGMTLYYDKATGQYKTKNE